MSTQIVEQLKVQLKQLQEDRKDHEKAVREIRAREVKEECAERLGKAVGRVARHVEQVDTLLPLESGKDSAEGQHVAAARSTLLDNHPSIAVEESSARNLDGENPCFATPIRRL